MVGCPSENTLVKFAEGRLGDKDSPGVQRHVDECAACRSQLSRLAQSPTINPDTPELQSTSPAPQPSAPEGFRNPEQIEEYRLIQAIGRGAMGQVYLGHDQRLDRLVAIKFMLNVNVDRASRERFYVEARAIARLSHPNVVTVYRIGEFQDRPYLVSEFIRGKSLADLPRPLAAKEVLRLGIGLSRGLAAAHRQGVLHRDIKPANTMLAEDGTVKLLDFGLAKLQAVSQASQVVASVSPDSAQKNAKSLALAATQADAPATSELPPVELSVAAAATALAASPNLTQVGAILGTPIYMAPEAWCGEPATARVDIYSLGVLLYELWAGRPPHIEKTEEALCTAVLNDAPPSLSTLVRDPDPRLAEVIERCLRKNPSERPASGEELSQALEQLADAAREEPPRPGKVRAFWAGLGRVQKMALGTMIGLLVAGTAFETGTLARKSWHQQQARRVKNARTIAILALEDRTGTPDSNTLTHGSWVDLQIQLQMVPGLRFLFQSPDEPGWTRPDLPRLAKDLGAGMYLSGWMKYERERLWIALSLRDIATDREWLKWELAGTATDYLRFRAAVPREVATLLGVPIPQRISERLANANTRRGDSVVAYLDNLGVPPGDLARVHRSIQALEGALERDPGFALGYAALAQRQAFLGVTESAYLSRAEGTARKAIALDPGLSFGHFSLATALLSQNQPSAARSEYERSLRLLAHNVAAQGSLANTLAAEGRFAEALAAGALVFYSAPHNVLYESISYTQFLLPLCTVELCDGWFRQQAEADRTGWGTVFSVKWLIQHGEIEKARQLLSRATQRNLAPDMVRPALLEVQVLANRVDPSVLAEQTGTDPTKVLGTTMLWNSWQQAYASWLQEHGRAEEAVPLLLQDLAEAQKDLAAQPGLASALMQVAGAVALLGKLDDAATWLERAYDAGYVLPAEIRSTPAFAKLREQPAGQKILAKMDAKITQMRKEAQEQGLFDFAAVTSGEWAEKRGAADYAEE